MERAWYSDFKAESNSIPVAKYVEIHHAPQMPLHAINEIPFSCSTSHSSPLRPYLSLRASRSDSRRQRMSSSRTERRFVSSCAHSSSFILQIHRSTQLRFREYLESERIIPGPLTLRIMLRVVSSINSTRTWVTPPREPICAIHQLLVTSTLPLLPYAMLNLPVRPKTRVTLTNLTGTFDESMFAV
jgi:hypothetical protein